MDKQPAKEATDVSMTPFDDYRERRGRRSLRFAPFAAVLRGLSALALGFAFASAAVIIVLDAVHWWRPEISWKVKTALPLIGIGISYALLQFTEPRTRKEFFLSMAVSLAFVLWGVEQFIRVSWIAARVDKAVVFLFVLDLGIVIGGQLRHSFGRPHES